MKFASAYGTFIKKRSKRNVETSSVRVKIVIGRDARISGKMIS